jgi:ANTAR domain
MIHREIYKDSSSRVVIDVAIGVLVGLRRCSEQQAFNEIAAAVRETGVGVGSVCRALVTLATDKATSFDPRLDVVVGRWSELVEGRSARRPLVAQN